MQLVDALAVKRGDVVAFVGAGGKTSTMARLARELVALGWRVLVTTTTRVAAEELSMFTASCSEISGAALGRLLEEKRCVFWYSRTAGEKVYGIAVDSAADLLRDVGADALLIEADGARRMPIKAPYAHEPVVPPETTLVVNVVGFGAFGQPLDDDHAYNAMGLAAAARVMIGFPIDKGVIWSALLLGAEGSVYQHRRFIPLLNSVPDRRHTRDVDLQIARGMQNNSFVERMVIGLVAEDGQVRYEARRRVCAIVLAAGSSTRMGRQKLLLPWGEGETVIEHVIKTTRAGGINSILLITGADADAVSYYGRLHGAPPHHNPDHAAGEMLSSLQVGLRVAQARRADAALIVLGDQPSMRSNTIRNILDAYADGRGTIIAPSHNMRRGHPILIDRVYWQELLDLPVGGAPRDVINRHAEQIGYVETDDSVLRDIDTPEAYAEERRRAFGTA